MWPESLKTEFVYSLQHRMWINPPQKIVPTKYSTSFYLNQVCEK